jgi:hypothetical protein
MPTVSGHLLGTAWPRARPANMLCLAPRALARWGLHARGGACTREVRIALVSGICTREVMFALVRRAIDKRDNAKILLVGCDFF